MKKEFKKRKLLLSKITVARLNQQQMRLFNGGETTKSVKPIIVTNNSLADDPNNPCVIPTISPTA